VVNFSQTLELVSKEMNIGFTLHNKVIGADEVFAETGLLPAILRRADQLCSFCFGYGLGVTFDESDQSRLGIKVNFNKEVPNVLRVMCAVEILYELAEAATNRTRIALDDLMYD
jgi:intracellular multiplication protein IcmS